jgi:hypothetical protein
MEVYIIVMTALQLIAAGFAIIDSKPTNLLVHVAIAIWGIAVL